MVAPASPWEIGHVETFHDKLSDELLSQELLFSLKEARAAVFDWIDHYNHERPHAGLGNLTPAQVRYGLETMSSIIAASEHSVQHKRAFWGGPKDGFKQVRRQDIEALLVDRIRAAMLGVFVRELGELKSACPALRSFSFRYAVRFSEMNR